ncbi:MAG TPA: DUF1802 family protein [Candidatus Saccharimonadales bacterium]|nr:DUF1802 family protein [Candidatus Saccharimonadales bacterium]
MRIAFKEWAVVVDALGRGDQIIILRKGGISEGRGGFQVEHPSFLFFPTLFHQQRESVLRKAQERYDQVAPLLPGPDKLRVEYFGELAAWEKLDSLAAAEKLRGQHIWRDEVIAERFDWGKSKNIFALAIRVYKLAAPIELQMQPQFGGCKSWVDLETEISTEGALPVLPKAAFDLKMRDFREALAGGKQGS